MHIDELDYNLPEELIAQKAIEPRDHARLLVVDRSTDSLTDQHFYDLPDYLSDGDCLVINDTRVLPARFYLRKPTGGRVEALFLREIEPGRWEMMIKGLARIKFGTELYAEGSAEVKFVPEDRLSPKTVAVRVSPSVSPVEFLGKVGHMPLPPYIHRKTADQQIEREDAEQYQTVFSQKPGAVAAPTAGLHFTPELLDKIRAMGVKIVTVTLHVGMGTFEPLTAEVLEDHQMHSEWYSVSPEAAETVNAAKSAGKKIIAVGTTSVRVLETAATDDGRLTPGDGWTSIFIYPPYRFKIVDRLVTNFHLPKTTLLAMIYALASQPLTQTAYTHAIAQRYRFFSYGDAMLIL
jgi:S-adenosylmethionine:tRNA ribosyltransferase-isomerase